MDVLSECPLTVGSVLWQSGSGAWTQTVVVKATFVLAPGSSELEKDAPEDVYEGDGYWDDDESKSLSVASDLVPFKRRPEVLLVGHAHGPGGKSVTSLAARLAIGRVDKVIEVRGDQLASRGSSPEPARFKRMPMRWERAAGGPDTQNPVGVRTGAAARLDAQGRAALPNLLPAGRGSAGFGEVIEPVCLAPISPRWPARASRLGALAGSFDPAAWNASPLPDSLDPLYFNAAPADQHLAGLDGREALTLEGLHPRHATLTTRLSPIVPRASFSWGKGPTYDLPLACDTLCIDADRGIAMLTFRGRIGLDHPKRTGSITVRMDAAPVSAQVPEKVSAPPPRESSPRAAQGAPPPRESSPRAAQGAPPPRESSPRAAPPALPAWVYRVADPLATLRDYEDEDRPTAPLKLNEEEAPTIPRRPRAAARFVATQPDEGPPKGPVLPFSPQEEGRSTEPGAPSSAAFRTEAARQELFVETTVDEPPPLPTDMYPLERCARIDASLARRPERRAKILDASDLDEATWGRLQQHWFTVMAGELRQKQNELLKAYDAAYVAQLEQERGPLSVEEHARIVVAAERGTLEEALRSLKLSQEMLVRIQRVWITRMVRDLDYGARIRRAIDAERGG